MCEYKVHRIRFVDFIPKAINATAFDNGSKEPKLALSREDGSIEIRNPSADWVVDRVIPGYDRRSVEHLVWCDGRLFSGSVSGDIIEWDLELLQPKYHQDSYGGPVWCLKFSYSKKVLAAGCEDGGIHLFEVFKDSIMYKGCLNKQEHRILCLAWAYDDQFIVTGGFDCTMNKCNVKTGHITSRMTTDNLKDKNTMVWSIEILKDMTIVIGDSLGNTQFWDGKTCTLFQSFKSHMADVLAVAVNQNEQVVYSTGVDSKVAEFKLIIQGNQKKWIMTKTVRATNHDTRTMCVCNTPYNCLISGGIDPRFIVYSMDNFDSQTFTRYSCLPKRDTCQLAHSANLLLFREQHSLHVWLLTSDEDSSIIESKAEKPKKLFEIRSDRPDHLICSAICDDGCHIAYSNINRGQLFELNISTPSVQKCAVNIPPSTHMCFLHGGNFLVTVGNQKNIKIININDGDCNTMQFPDSISTKLPFSFLCQSYDDSNICVVDSISNAFIFSIVHNEYVTSLPKIDGVITSCMFAPNKNNIFFVTSKKYLYEYNIHKGKFELWCFDVNKSEIITSMGNRKDKANVVINPQLPKQIFIQEKEIFGKIIYGSTIPSVITGETKKEKRKKCEEIFKTNGHYNSIMFFDFNSSGEIVLVERLMDSILEKLPAPLKIKQFGS